MKTEKRHVETISTPLPVRLDYGAIPLDPWNAKDANGTYAEASIDRITHKLDMAVADAVNHGWVGSFTLADELRAFMQTSLYWSHMDRINHNAKSAEALNALTESKNDELIDRAKEGTATPTDLLNLLIIHPELHSLELAKLTHPLDPLATEAMDDDICDTVVGMEDGRICIEPPRYKSKRLNDDMSAAIILRKQAIAEHDTPHGVIQIVQRKAFLVRGDDEVETDPLLARKIKNPERFEELTDKIESYLPNLETHPHLKWLQVQATSYYAKYLPETSE